MNHLKRFGLVCGFLLLTVVSFGQNTKTLAERLGYSADAKLLIIHADDIGVTHSENAASISAFEKGPLKSGSIMVPCPWFPEIAAYARKHPKFDLGLHLTLTSEWKYYKWNGVMPSDVITSLISDSGFFYGGEEAVEKMVQHADLEDVEKELRAQIDRAIAYGIKPTHLDSHMGGPTATPELFGIVMKLGREYKIPVRITKSMLENPDYKKQVPPDYNSVVKNYTLHQDTQDKDWNKAYDKVVNNMKTGLNELVVHLAYDNEEMQAVTVDRKHWWNAPWRQRDYDYVTSKRFKDLLRENNIHVVTFSEIQQLMYPEMTKD